MYALFINVPHRDFKVAAELLMVNIGSNGDKHSQMFRIRKKKMGINIVITTTLACFIIVCS
jgi:hypothetical protein